jgi:hypothetical protein
MGSVLRSSPYDFKVEYRPCVGLGSASTGTACQQSESTLNHSYSPLPLACLATHRIFHCSNLDTVVLPGRIVISALIKNDVNIPVTTTKTSATCTRTYVAEVVMTRLALPLGPAGERRTKFIMLVRVPAAKRGAAALARMFAACGTSTV